MDAVAGFQVILMIIYKIGNLSFQAEFYFFALMDERVLAAHTTFLNGQQHGFKIGIDDG